MCYNLKSSIFAYVLGMTAGIIALSSRQIVLGCLIIFYVQMQLSEGLIWYGIDNNKPIFNKIGTTYGKYILPSHLIGIGLGIIFSTLYISKQKLTMNTFIPLIIGIIFFICISIYYKFKNSPSLTFPRKPCGDKSCQSITNRLVWPWPSQWYYILFIIMIIISYIYLKPLKSKLILAIIYSIMILLFIIIYTKAHGTIWCIFAAILAPLIVLINYFIIKKLPNNEIRI
jgi:hypothetical protein